MLDLSKMTQKDQHSSYPNVMQNMGFLSIRNLKVLKRIQEDMTTKKHGNL